MTATAEHLAMSRIGDDLDAQYGPSLDAATLAVVEAQAEADKAWQAAGWEPTP